MQTVGTILSIIGWVMFIPLFIKSEINKRKTQNGDHSSVEPVSDTLYKIDIAILAAGLIISLIF